MPLPFAVPLIVESLQVTAGPLKPVRLTVITTLAVPSVTAYVAEERTSVPPVGASSFRMVATAVWGAPRLPPTGVCSASRMVSLGSKVRSPFTVISNVLEAASPSAQFNVTGAAGTV